MSVARTHIFPQAQLRTIVNGVLAPEPVHFSLVGARFMGKSLCLTHLASAEGPLRASDAAGMRPQAFQRGEQILALYCSGGRQTDEGGLLAFLARRLAQHLPEMDPPLALQADAEGEAPAAWLQRAVPALERAGYRLVLLLDDFDRLPAQDAGGVEAIVHLGRSVAMVTASRRPLHELDGERATSSLSTLFNQVFLRLVESDVAREFVVDLTAGCDDREHLVTELVHLSGGHPFLLSRLDAILLDVGEMVAGGQPLSRAHLPLIRLRLAEEYARLIFDAFWRELAGVEGGMDEQIRPLLEQMVTRPIPLDRLQPDHTRAMNWLINRAVVRIRDNAYALFSPLLRDYLLTRLELDGVGVRGISAASLSAREAVDKQVHLFTPQEKSLLDYFLQHPNEIVAVDQLLTDVWKRPDASARRVQEGIRRLRHRLASLDVTIGTIENEWGQGYRFVLDSGQE